MLRICYALCHDFKKAESCSKAVKQFARKSTKCHYLSLGSVLWLLMCTDFSFLSVILLHLLRHQFPIHTSGMQSLISLESSWGNDLFPFTCNIYNPSPGMSSFGSQRLEYHSSKWLEEKINTQYWLEAEACRHYIDWRQKKACRHYVMTTCGIKMGQEWQVNYQGT